jgi:hypothetical protein
MEDWVLGRHGLLQPPKAESWEQGVADVEGDRQFPFSTQYRTEDEVRATWEYRESMEGDGGRNNGERNDGRRNDGEHDNRGRNSPLWINHSWMDEMKRDVSREGQSHVWRC